MTVAELMNELREKLNAIKPLNNASKIYFESLILELKKIYPDTDVYFQTYSTEDLDARTLHDIDGSMTPIDNRKDIIFY